MPDPSFEIVGTVDPVGRAAVAELMADQTIKSVWYGNSIESTNSLALEQLATEPNLPLPRLVLADQQTSGRGRRGRSWLSSEQTLTLSLVIDQQPDAETISRLSLAIGVGVARFIEFEFAPVLARLKWPNDVYVSGGKVAGVLLETHGTIENRIVIGIGLNVGAPPTVDNATLPAPICSLTDATGRILNRYDCLASLVYQVLAATQELDEVVDEYRSRCMLTGQTIRFQRDGTDQMGQCLGVDSAGELIVQIHNETTQLRSGEVQMIRRRNNL